MEDCLQQPELYWRAKGPVLRYVFSAILTKRFGFGFFGWDFHVERRLGYFCGIVLVLFYSANKDAKSDNVNFSTRAIHFTASLIVYCLTSLNIFNYLNDRTTLQIFLAMRQSFSLTVYSSISLFNGFPNKMELFESNNQHL